jgi:hypothetical protein
MPLFLFGQPPAAPAPGGGEAPPPGTPPPEAARTVQFSVFVWPEGGVMNEESHLFGPPRVFYDAPDGNMTLVPLYLNRSTPLLTYQGPQPLNLYDIDRAWIPPPEDAPPGTPPVIQITRTPRVVANFPEGLDRAMIIVFPGRRNGVVLQSILLPYGTENVRPGMSRILNGTDQELALRFSDQDENPLILRPGRPFDFRPGDYTQDPYPRIFIYGLDENRRLRLMHTNRINFQGENTNFFIVIPEGVRRVRIKSLGSFENGE